MNLNNLFAGRRATNEQTEAPATPAPETPATVAAISANLDAAKAAIDTVASKIALAQDELNRARSDYDARVTRYALDGGSQPDGTAVEKEITKLEALRRVLRDKQTECNRLGIELAQAQRTESTASEADELNAMRADVEDKLSALEIAALQYTRCERELMACFASLERNFSTEELNRLARQTRFRIRDGVRELVKATGARSHPNFETFGRPNLGSQEGQWDAHVQKMHSEAKRIGESMPDLREVGELVVEVPMER